MNKSMVLGSALVGLVFVGCGGAAGEPPPEVPEATPVASSAPRTKRPGAQVSQELGSIDPDAVEQTFQKQHGPLEGCHKAGLDRHAFMSGDVKVFLRIDTSGRVRYGYFEETTLGDRDTERCIVETLSKASWPKPEGGEAEVRSGFGWAPDGREPTAWSSDKVTGALASSAAKSEIDKCRAGVTGDFKVTGYVEHDDAAPEEAKPTKGKPKAAPKPRGRFTAVGVAAPNKEASEKVDCVVDALKSLELPSPGSYAAKVSFSL